jgi:hypothetical protein
MSFIDIFARIVLLILITMVVAIFAALGMAPGLIARKRGHPWAQGISARCGIWSLSHSGHPSNRTDQARFMSTP